MCLDARQRKMIVGCSNGDILVNNCANGAQMKAGFGVGKDGHDSEVSCLVYCIVSQGFGQNASGGRADIVLSTGWDGALKLWDESAVNTLELLRSVKHGASLLSNYALPTRLRTSYQIRFSSSFVPVAGNFRCALCFHFI